MSQNSQELLNQALENLKQREEKFQTQQDEITRLQAELTDKSTKLQQLQTIIIDRQSEIDSLKAALTAKESEIKQLKSKVPELSERSATTIRLKTAWGIDYTPLQQLLSAQQWQAANQETATKMLEVMGRTETGYLSEQDIHKFPGADFQTIDALWTKYSQKRFGFSVQKHIFESMGYKISRIDYDCFKLFINRLGWAAGDPRQEWLGAHVFDVTAPPGHLPEIASHVNWKDAQFPLTQVIIRLRGQRALFSLLQQCKKTSD